MVQKNKNAPVKTNEAEDRLTTIAATALGTLSDEEVLSLLAERKKIQENQRRQEEEAKKRREEEARIEQERETQRVHKQELEKELARLNGEISPEKPDDELLALIEQRKQIEKELDLLGSLPKETPSSEARDAERRDDSANPLIIRPRTAAVPKAAEATAPETESRVEQVAPERKSDVSAVQMSKNETETTTAPISNTTAVSSPPLKDSLKEDFGKESVVGDALAEGSEFRRYYDQLKSNVAAIGTLLQEMPASAKRHKAFMLKVAEIDPAYAMHYADVTLKKDEDFNVKIASMNNPRHSGNALAEMLPEARTSKVLMAAIRRDYQNIKYAARHVEGYAEMLEIARSAALEKIKQLKHAADAELLIPKQLKEDAAFMTEVKAMTAGIGK